MQAIPIALECLEDVLARCLSRLNLWLLDGCHHVVLDVVASFIHLVSSHVEHLKLQVFLELRARG